MKNRCEPVMVRGANRGAGRAISGRAIPGRVIPGRVIIGEPRMAADAPVAVKLSAATPISINMRFVFIDNIAFLPIKHRDGVLSC